MDNVGSHDIHGVVKKDIDGFTAFVLPYLVPSTKCDFSCLAFG